MIVQYDYQIFYQQRYGGISRYFFELISGMKARTDVQVGQLNIFLADNVYLEALKTESIFRKIHFKGKKTIANLINKTYSSHRLKKGGYDIFHPTYYDPYCLAAVGSKPVVITICDLVDEKFYKQIPVFKRLTEQRKKMIERADLIIAISENTKKDLVAIYNVNPAKVRVIYMGNSLAKQAAITAPFRAKNRLLYVGTRKGTHKNFIPFVKAIAPLLSGNRELQLVCGGGGEFNREEIKLFETLHVSGQLRYEPIRGNDSLAALYNSATVFIYPSLYEGFGFPLIEAFTCGCPVVSSRGSSMDEIGSDAAYYFDPYDPGSMLNTVRTVLLDDMLQTSLVEKGYQRAKDFDWAKTVGETHEAYEALLSAMSKTESIE